MSPFRLAVYCPGCLPALHAPLYAAVATGAFRAADLDVELLPPVASEDRLERLRTGSVDLAFMDLASFVDTTTVEPDLGARCMFVLTQRFPMAAHVVMERPAGGAPIESPEDLVRARYGGQQDSRFVAEHRALLRRLGGDDPDLRVDLPYGQLFSALASGQIDAAPDYGGITTRYARAAQPARTRRLPYRDCGIDAYGLGFVASAAGLATRADEIQAVCGVLAAAYERMQDDPEAVIADAALMVPDLDREYALNEWLEEESPLVFGYGAGASGIGSQDADGWAATASWRREVTGADAEVAVEYLFAPLPIS